MATAICVVVILVGLFLITPYGASIGLRANQAHEDDKWKAGGWRAKSKPGVQLTGVILVAVATYLLVTGGPIT